MIFRVTYAEQAVKQLSKLDLSVRIMIVSWIVNNLEGTDDPRLHGKPLTGSYKGMWRYRVGDYRILTQIKDQELIIHVVK